MINMRKFNIKNKYDFFFLKAKYVTIRCKYFVNRTTGTGTTSEEVRNVKNLNFKY